MSFLRTMKLALLNLIDPRLKLNFIDLELEDTEIQATKLMRARRTLRKEQRALTTAAKKAVATRIVLEEDDPPTVVKVRKTTTKRVRTKRTTPVSSEDDEPITGKLTKDKVMRIIAKHTAPKPAAEPQRPPKAKQDNSSSFRSIRQFIAPELPEITDDDERKVVRMLGVKQRRRA